VEDSSGSRRQRARQLQRPAISLHLVRLAQQLKPPQNS